MKKSRLMLRGLMKKFKTAEQLLSEGMFHDPKVMPGNQVSNASFV
jgi:hypothetical protein